MRRLAFILNPRSGKQSIRRSKSEILSTLLAGYPGRYDVFETHYAGHAAKLSAEAAAAGYDVVVAYGGDGTINEVARGLVGTASALGIIPAGSGNGMAHGLGIPSRPRRALEVITSAPIRRIDVGRVNGDCFFNVFGLGFDAALAERFHREAGGVRGALPYFTLGIKTFLRYKPPLIAYEIDGELIEVAPLTLAIANGPEYGTGARIAPEADFSDGWLDLVLLPKMPALRAALALPRLFSGSVARVRGREHRRAKHLSISLPPNTPVHFDGEARTCSGKLDIWVEPGALGVAAPPRR